MIVEQVICLQPPPRQTINQLIFTYLPLRYFFLQSKKSKKVGVFCFCLLEFGASPVGDVGSCFRVSHVLFQISVESNTSLDWVSDTFVLS